MQDTLGVNQSKVSRQQYSYKHPVERLYCTYNAHCIVVKNKILPPSPPHKYTLYIHYTHEFQYVYGTVERYCGAHKDSQKDYEYHCGSDPVYSMIAI